MKPRLENGAAFVNPAMSEGSVFSCMGFSQMARTKTVSSTKQTWGKRSLQIYVRRDVEAAALLKACRLKDSPAIPA
jgi:hypothetical protein